MATASIKLTRFVPKNPCPPAKKRAWFVSILAEGINIDDHVFVYHVGKPDDPIPGDKFECVASVNQMQEIPKNQGVSLTTQLGIPYYRSNVLQYVCRSVIEAKFIWDEVVVEVHDLVENWNAGMELQATEFAEISTEIVTTKGYTMTPPIRIALSYHPAGVPGIEEDKPVVVSPDTARPGWLPVSVFTGGTVPSGAVFFYNRSMDSHLSEVWPPETPYSGNQLTRNGIQMPYGVVWSITETGLWWLDFDPATIPGYERVSGQEEDWGAPWPMSYVSPSNPGPVPNMIVLTLFKQV